MSNNKRPRTEADDTAKLKDLMRSELLRILMERDDDSIDDLVDTIILAIDCKVAHAQLRSAAFVEKMTGGTGELVDEAIRTGMRELAARGEVPK